MQISEATIQGNIRVGGPDPILNITCRLHLQLRLEASNAEFRSWYAFGYKWPIKMKHIHDFSEPERILTRMKRVLQDGVYPLVLSFQSNYILPYNLYLLLFDEHVAFVRFLYIYEN